MEAIVIITGAIILWRHSVKDDYQEEDYSGIYQENEQKQHHNDNFWPF